MDTKARFPDAVYLHRAVRHGAGEFMQIPYRMLLPKGVEGLLVAGKCASGASSVRSTGSCMAMGQAAGVAAALAARANAAPRAVPITTLQEALRAQGVLLDGPRRVTL